MPRRTMTTDTTQPVNAALAERLRASLKDQKEFGQPIVYELPLRSDRLRVTVVWDDWNQMAFDERTAVILRAYELAEGSAYRSRIALANGLTVPEATAAGMLPFQVTTAIRKSDPVSFDECRNAMLAEGASELFEPGAVQLRFASLAEAEACRKRLIASLPRSEEVWLINREVGVQESTTREDAEEMATA